MGGDNARDIASNDVGHAQRNALRGGEKPVTGLAVISTRILKENTMGLVEGFDSEGKGNVAPLILAADAVFSSSHSNLSGGLMPKLYG